MFLLSNVWWLSKIKQGLLSGRQLTCEIWSVSWNRCSEKHVRSKVWQLLEIPEIKTQVLCRPLNWHKTSCRKNNVYIIFYSQCAWLPCISLYLIELVVICFLEQSSKICSNIPFILDFNVGTLYIYSEIINGRIVFNLWTAQWFKLRNSKCLCYGLTYHTVKHRSLSTWNVS